jgi:hypothetical protein
MEKYFLELKPGAIKVDAGNRPDKSIWNIGL